MLCGLLLLELGLQGVGVVVRGLDEDHKRSPTLSDHRILALGACYTVGVGSEPEESYPRQLEFLLDERQPELDLSVINGGIRGMSIGYFATWIDGMLDDAAPEVLIVNVNDRLTFTSEDVSEVTGGRQGVRRRLDRALSRLVLYRVVKVALTPPAERTALPEDWWGAGAGGTDGNDQLSHAITQAEAAVQERPEDADAWEELARLSEKRLNYERAVDARLAAIGLEGGRPASHHYRQLVWIRASQRRYAEAERHLEQAVMASEGYENSLLIELRRNKNRMAQDNPLEVMVYKLRLADYYALFGDLGEAIRVLQEVVTGMPSLIQARDLLAFYEALQRSRETGEPLAEQAGVDLDALFTKDRGGQEGMGQFGIYEAKEGDLDLVSAAEAEARFRAVLEHNLVKILRAADARGISVILENLSSLPDQAPVIEGLSRTYDVPLVDLQGALAAHPDRAALLHPTMNLRLSAEGNRFVAEQIYAALDAEGLLQ